MVFRKSIQYIDLANDIIKYLCNSYNFIVKSIKYYTHGVQKILFCQKNAPLPIYHYLTIITKL